MTPDCVIEANKGYEGKFITHGSARDYVQRMADYGIEKAFIMPFNDPRMLSMEFTVEAVHDNLLEIAEAYPGKFYCFADIDVRKPLSDTLEEFDRVFQNDYFIGIKLHPENTGLPIDGPYYEGVFRYAEQRDILLEIHSYPAADEEDDPAAPFRICKMLKKYPKLRVSIAHLGGFHYQELPDTVAYLNIAAVLPDFVKHYGTEKTNQILRALGPERLVFASDYPDSKILKPDAIYPRYFEILGKMDFTPEEEEKILRSNAMRMAGLLPESSD